MKPRLLLLYQLLTGASDTATGLLLVFAPALTMRLMNLHPPTGALPFLAYIGAFVTSVGIACFYGALLTTHPNTKAKLEVVWLLTAITRGLVAAFVFTMIFSHQLEPGWLTVAISDGALALFQAIGLQRGWLNAATR